MFAQAHEADTSMRPGAEIMVRFHAACNLKWVFAIHDKSVKDISVSLIKGPSQTNLIISVSIMLLNTCSYYSKICDARSVALSLERKD